MKNVICFILILSLVFSICPVNADPIEYTNKTELAKFVLGSNGLDIVGFIPSLWSGFPRARMAKTVCVMCGIRENVDDAEVSQKLEYIDVPAEHWAYRYIECGTSLGIFRGYGNDKFRPDMVCTYGEYFKTMICTTGWINHKKELTYENPYPTLYTAIAEDLGFKFQKDRLDEYATIDDIFLLTYEALMFNTVISRFSNDPYDVGREMLKENFDIDHVAGKLSVTEQNTIKIGDMEFSLFKSEYKKLDGKYVVCYYKYNENIEQNEILVMACVTEQLCDEILADDAMVLQRYENQDLIDDIYY